jgi:hypothetical protein
MSVTVNIFFGAGSIIGNLKIFNYCGGMVAYGAGSPSRALLVSEAAAVRRNN